jgi:Flp pilus assembly protein TadD
VIELKPMATPAVGTVVIKNGDPRAYLEAARTALVEGRAEEALSAARSAIGSAPKNAEARLTAARALRRLRRVAEASDELRRAAELDPGHPDIQLELGYAAVCQGDLRAAVERWEQFLRAAPGSIAADEVRDALASAARLSEFLEAYAGV